MVLHLDHQPMIELELLNWPPLRVYTTENGTQWLPIADLVYLEGELNYTWLNWACGRRVLIPATLKRFESMLPTTWFVRVHRHHLVNRRFIERLVNDNNGPCVHLTTGLKCPVARRRWPVVLEKISYQQSRI